jgi:hypothetical protein
LCYINKGIHNDNLIVAKPKVLYVSTQTKSFLNARRNGQDHSEQEVLVYFLRIRDHINKNEDTGDVSVIIYCCV